MESPRKKRRLTVTRTLSPLNTQLLNREGSKFDDEIGKLAQSQKLDFLPEKKCRAERYIDRNPIISLSNKS